MTDALHPARALHPLSQVSAEAALRFMWGEKQVGDKSIMADQLRKGDHFLIREQNAVPFDSNAGWKDGSVYNVGFAVYDDKITNIYLMV